MSEKTHAEITMEMRNRAKRPDFVSQDVLKSCADELDAAHRREMDELRKQVGNAAKLREAMLSIKADILKRRSENVWYITDSDILEKIDAALAAPPRNCERFQTKDAAREAFQKLRGHRVMADVSLWDDRDEIEAFLDWLFALGKEGGVE